MNESPPGNEKPTGKGGLLTDSAFTISETQPDCNSESYSEAQERMTREYLAACESAGIKPDASYKAMPQNFTGDGTREDRHFENDVSVPVTLPPQDAEPEKLSRDRIANRALMEWIRLCEFHRGKCTAFLVVINEEKGHPDDIAKALGITERQFRNYRTEARVWLDGFIAALESEVTP